MLFFYPKETLIANFILWANFHSVSTFFPKSISGYFLPNRLNLVLTFSGGFLDALD